MQEHTLGQHQHDQHTQRYLGLARKRDPGSGPLQRQSLLRPGVSTSLHQDDIVQTLRPELACRLRCTQTTGADQMERLRRTGIVAEPGFQLRCIQLADRDRLGTGGLPIRILCGRADIDQMSRPAVTHLTVQLHRICCRDGLDHH